MKTGSTSWMTRAEAERKVPRWTWLDTFVVLNLGLDSIVWGAVNLSRYRAALGTGHMMEVIGYGLGLLTPLVGLWCWPRRQYIPLALLVIAQLALLVHFAGALILIPDVRLNALTVLGIRFNKFTVFVCTFAVAWLLAKLAEAQKLHRNAMLHILVALAAFGIGAGVEVFQYLAMRLASVTDVARFEESERDLIACLAGAALWLLWTTVFRRRAPNEKDFP